MEGYATSVKVVTIVDGREASVEWRDTGLLSCAADYTKYSPENHDDAREQRVVCFLQSLEVLVVALFLAIGKLENKCDDISASCALHARSKLLCFRYQ